nr:metallopeptidase TldD-related protein [uncultured Faecalimonas sp.]
MISRENKQRAEELKGLLEREGFSRIQFYLQEQYGYEVNVFSQETDRKSVSRELRVFVEAWKEDQRYYTYANSLECPQEIAGRLREAGQSETSGGMSQEHPEAWTQDECDFSEKLCDTEKLCTLEDLRSTEEFSYVEEFCCAKELCREEELLRRAERAALDHGADVVNECACYHQRTETAIYHPERQWLEDSGEYRYLGVSAIARADGDTAAAYAGAYGVPGEAFSPEMLAEEVAGEAKARLHSVVLPSGVYKVLLKNTVMAELLEAYLPIFYGNAMQEGMSRLEGREKTRIASEKITVVEDPELDGGRETRTIDDEGNAVQKKYLIREGIFETALYHNASAKEADEKQSTGNGFKADFRSEIGTGVTNVEMRSSDGRGKTLEEMMRAAGEGILVTGIDGTFAGVDARTGNFSLISKGVVIREGKKAEAFSQVTIAGNFYEMLRQITEVGNDPAETPPSAAFVRAPSVYVGNLTVSGK